MNKVAVGGQQDESMANRELRQHCIDGPDLYPVLAAAVTQGRGLDRVVPIGDDQGEDGEAFDQGGLGFGPPKALK